MLHRYMGLHLGPGGQAITPAGVKDWVLFGPGRDLLGGTKRKEILSAFDRIL
jgi:hypothetical protein